MEFKIAIIFLAQRNYLFFMDDIILVTGDKMEIYVYSTNLERDKPKIL